MNTLKGNNLTTNVVGKENLNFNNKSELLTPRNESNVVYQTGNFSRNMTTK